MINYKRDTYTLFGMMPTMACSFFCILKNAFCQRVCVNLLAETATGLSQNLVYYEKNVLNLCNLYLISERPERCTCLNTSLCILFSQNEQISVQRVLMAGLKITVQINLHFMAEDRRYVLSDAKVNEKSSRVKEENLLSTQNI